MALPRDEPPALDTSVPFTRAEARAAGLAVDLLRGRGFRRVLYDLYVAASTTLTPALLAQAVLRIAPPDSYVSHHTAAKLWGGVVPDVCETHLTVPHKENRLDRVGVRSHVPRAGAARPVELRGVRLSSPAQTFLDLAASGVNLVDLIVLGDSLVKRRRTTPEALIEAADGWSQAGGRVARRAALYVRDGVDSPQESRLRMLLILAGLPEPRVNRIVRSPNGSWLRRFDMSYDEYDVLVEYDGRQHAENVEQWLGDIARREEMDGMNLRIIVVTSHGIFEEPGRTLTRVRDVSSCGAPAFRRCSGRNGSDTSRAEPDRSRQQAGSRDHASAPGRRNGAQSSEPAPSWRLGAATGAGKARRLSQDGEGGAVSERMSMRHPVSRAASRAFWPSRPMASDS